MTGRYPNEKELNEFSKELVHKMSLSEDTIKQLRQLPKDLHPMSKLSIGIMLLQNNSKFLKA